jgi:hypothetical protein
MYQPHGGDHPEAQDESWSLLSALKDLCRRRLRCRCFRRRKDSQSLDSVVVLHELEQQGIRLYLPLHALFAIGLRCVAYEMDERHPALKSHHVRVGGIKGQIRPSAAVVGTASHLGLDLFQAPEQKPSKPCRNAIRQKNLHQFKPSKWRHESPVIMPDRLRYRGLRSSETAGSDALPVRPGRLVTRSP